MCKEVCKVVVLLNKPIAFLTFLLPSPSSLLKAPWWQRGGGGGSSGIIQITVFLGHENKLFQVSKNSHFQNEATCKIILAKVSFICLRIKNHFHINGFAFSLHSSTCTSPIMYLICPPKFYICIRGCSQSSVQDEALVSSTQGASC